MKKILTILIILLISQFAFAQTEAYKFAEFEENGRGCENYFRYQDFIMKLNANVESTGLVVIYAGDAKERFGNVLAYLGGAKFGVENWLKFPKDRVSITVLKGRNFFAQEFWIIPKGAKLPYAESFKFDWSKIDSKYYFSNACLQCEGDYSFWTSSQAGFKEYAQILKQYPNYKGQIIVNNYRELSQIKAILTNSQKLTRNRYSIQLRKKKKGEENSISVDCI